MDNIRMKMDISDTSLLREFVNGKGSRHFRQLVERYQGLVFSTALRRLHDRGLAEEVAQDVFVSLSKKARLLVGHSNLAGWLYTTSLKKAANRMKSETRRKQREERFANETLIAAERAAVPTEAFEHMDEALARLGEKDREALVLRFFQGLDLNEVGKSQGSTAEAARKRVTRALQKLRSAFGKKGIALPTSTAVAAVLTGSMEAAPASLLGGALSGVAVPSGASFITSLLNTIIIMTKKQIAVAIFVVLAIPFGIRQAIQSNSTDEPQRSEQQTSVTPVTSPSDRPRARIVTPPSSERGEESVAPAQVNLNFQGMLDRYSDSQTRIRKDLATALGLHEGQLARMDTVFDERLETLKGYMDDDTGLGETDEGMRKVGALLRGVGLRDALAGILTEKQLAGYDDYKQAEWSRQVEARAYKELSRITPVLELTEEQKDQVFSHLYDVASTKVEDEQDFRAVMSLISGLPPTEVGTSTIGMGKVIKLAEREGMEVGSAEFLQKLEEFESKRIDEELEPLAPILSEEQMARYRKHLSASGLLPLMATPAGG